MRCPRCGGLNPQGAEWCGQCFTRFEVAGSASKPQAGPGSPPDAEDATAETSVFAEVYGEPEPPPLASRARPEIEPAMPKTEGARPQWGCPVCRGRNDLDRDTCATCGTSMFSAFGHRAGPAETREPRNPRLAAALSILPGMGHIYLGRSGDAVVRITLALWWFGLAVMLGGVSALRPIGAVFLIAGTGLVVITMSDAYRQAEDPEAEPFLSRRVILYASLALVGVLIFGVTMFTILSMRQ